MVVVMESLATLTLCVFIALSFCGEALTNIEDHVDQEMEESFVSFQISNRHICGGARVKSKLVLITSHCELRISLHYDNVVAVIPALPDGRRHGYTIECLKPVETTIFYLVVLKLPENERSRNIAVISLTEDVFGDGKEGGVIGWNQVNETYMVKSVCNIEYEPEYISVFDHLCDDYNSFQDQYTGALLSQNKHLVGIASCVSALPRIHFIFEYIRTHGMIKKIKKAMKNPSRLSCFTRS